jgi:beta-glucosidase
LLGACADDHPTDLVFPQDFRFGAATAATQIEDQNTNADWYLFSQPKAQGGLGRGAAFVGDAVRGYSLAIPDIALLAQLHVDSYRFSMEWARIEPQRGHIDEAALAHYGALLDALRAAGIRPLVTLHHFSNPLWLDDPRDPTCASGPSDTNLCGLGHPVGGPLVVQAFAAHARLLAQRFGDRVDDWGTLNEPMNYLLAAYGLAQFPPAKSMLLESLPAFARVLRDYLAAHAAMYDAIHAADTVDADGDGIAAQVGLSESVADWVAARDNRPSSRAADLAARDRMVSLMHHLFIDSLLDGTFDADLDGVVDEQHPEWRGRLDWLGVQYYARLGVTGATSLLAGLNLLPCFQPLDLGSCVPATDPTYCVPMMGYESYPQGLTDVLVDFGRRWPRLPLLVTEAGLATDVGQRRAQNVVRILEAIARARGSGVDVRGYYHWSLMDNFEWLEGFRPHFGLYSVDHATYARTPTLGAQVLGEIAAVHSVTAGQRERYGGTGPMAPEAGQTPMCDPLP